MKIVFQFLALANAASPMQQRMATSKPRADPVNFNYDYANC